MTAKRIPEVIVSDNPYGVMFFGPGGPTGLDDLSEYTMCTDSGHYRQANANGNAVSRTPGRHDELCGDRLGNERENIAKSITAKNGDICITAENGNIKLKAKNIWIETTGSGNEGAFHVSSNGQIIIASTDNMVLSSSKLCLRGESGIDIVSSHYIRFIGVLQKGSPFSSIIGLPGPLNSLLEGIINSCK
jgi:hypothetical protein